MKQIFIILFVLLFTSCNTSYKYLTDKAKEIRAMPDTIIYMQSYDIIWGKILKWFEFWGIEVEERDKINGIISTNFAPKLPPSIFIIQRKYDMLFSVKTISSDSTEVITRVKVYFNINNHGMQEESSDKFLEFCLNKFLLNNSLFFADTLSKKNEKFPVTIGYSLSDSNERDVLGDWKYYFSWQTSNSNVNDFHVGFHKNNICFMQFYSADTLKTFRGYWNIKDNVLFWEIEKTKYKCIFDNDNMVGIMKYNEKYLGSFFGERLNPYLQNFTK